MLQVLTDIVVELISKPPRRTSKPMLRVLQWNADDLFTKVQELRDRWTTEIVDVFLIPGWEVVFVLFSRRPI